MSASPATIRRLGPGDVHHLRELNAVFGEAFADRQTYGAEPPDDGYLGRLLAREHVVALAALAGGAVVGGLVAYRLDKAERARSGQYVYDLAVAAGHRRRGVATALMARLREIAAECGAWVVFVQADRGDGPAIALYDKLGGTREEVLHFDIAAEAPGGPS